MKLLAKELRYKRKVTEIISWFLIFFRTSLNVLYVILQVTAFITLVSKESEWKRKKADAATCWVLSFFAFLNVPLHKVLIIFQVPVMIQRLWLSINLNLLSWQMSVVITFNFRMNTSKSNHKIVIFT